MVGRTVLQYRFLEKLGAGGMGEVYKARDTRLNRFVAIKVLHSGVSADREQRRRFIYEAQAASSLNHPNIITIYDSFSEGDNQYMVSEYVNGKTLLEVISKGALRVPQAVGYAIQMADALGAAHAAGIIHRDVKPANVMITGSGLVKVLDFGLAKLMEELPGDHTGTTVTAIGPLTVAGAVMGTVNYMSPEQAQGRRVTARSDIFSFGAVLYEMLTGQCAFRGDSPVATLSAVLRDEVRPVIELTPDVPPELDRIVAQCLKKDPDERFQTMPELQAALVSLKRRYDSGAPDEPTIRTVLPPPLATRWASKTLAIAAAVMIALALAGIGGGYWWTTRRGSVTPAVKPPAPLAAAAAPDGTLTNDSIVEMAKAQVAPNVIVSQIRASKTNFNLSAAEVIRLTKAGVPSDVIEAMRNPRAAPAPVATPVILRDGSPIRLTLAKDIPNDALPDEALSFEAADDVKVDGSVVIAKGAAAAGAIVDGARRKMLVIRSKMTFQLDSVNAVDGQKVALRATPDRRDGSSKRSVDTGGRKPRGVAAAAGAAYVGYIEGTNTVMVKR
jgi:serine/threonine-protein kinase